MYAAQMESGKGNETLATKYGAFGRETYQLLCGTMYGFDEGFQSS